MSSNEPDRYRYFYGDGGDEDEEEREKQARRREEDKEEREKEDKEEREEDKEARVAVRGGPSRSTRKKQKIFAPGFEPKVLTPEEKEKVFAQSARYGLLYDTSSEESGEDCAPADAWWKQQQQQQQQQQLGSNDGEAGSSSDNAGSSSDKSPAKKTHPLLESLTEEQRKLLSPEQLKLVEGLLGVGDAQPGQEEPGQDADIDQDRLRGNSIFASPEAGEPLMQQEKDASMAFEMRDDADVGDPDTYSSKSQRPRTPPTESTSRWKITEDQQEETQQQQQQEEIRAEASWIERSDFLRNMAPPPVPPSSNRSSSSSSPGSSSSSTSASAKKAAKDTPEKK